MRPGPAGSGKIGATRPPRRTLGCTGMTTTRRFGWTSIAALALVLAIPGAFDQASAQEKRSVVLVQLTGTVDPLSAHYVKRSIANASNNRAAAVVVRIDTPGG